jgi:hypothetical protein
MADGERKLRNRDIQGLKYFRKLQPLLARLHSVGIQRDVAGNRNLHMDQYCTLMLEKIKGTGCVGESRRKVANERVARGKT